MVNYVYKPSIYKKIANKISRLVQISSLKKVYYRDPSILGKLFQSHKINKSTVALDIGSGPAPKNPFGAQFIYGADLRGDPSNSILKVDLSVDKLPFKDDMFDYVTAHDVLEHIIRVTIDNGQTNFPLISLMNEVFRVLKPGGIFFNIQPCFPFKESFQDPTHVNIMSEDTM